MRLTCVLLAAALLSACGGGQPRYYIISIDRTPLESLPASCYTGGAVPTSTDKSTNTAVVQRWVIWDGVDGKLWLEVGSMGGPLRLGNAADIQTPGVISGGPTSFTSVRDVVSPSRSTKTSVAVAFTDLSGTARGTLTLESNTTCTGCGVPNCTAALPFTGRRLEASPVLNYNNP